MNHSLEENVFFILDVHSSFILFPHPKVKNQINFRIGPDDAIEMMKLQHYSNQILQLLIPFSILSLLSEKSNDSEICLTPTVVQNYVFLRQLFSDDFVYPRNSEVEVSNFVA